MPQLFFGRRSSLILRLEELATVCGDVLMEDAMFKPCDILVTSSRVEDRRALMRILDGLPINVFSSSTVKQAEEVMSQKKLALVFCDEHLPDGSYRELLSRSRTAQKHPRLVVTTHTGEWNEYLEATRRGAFDVIRYPLQPADVELIVIRAMRDQRDASAA
jgi:DNA-binding NtrC family response regulator